MTETITTQTDAATHMCGKAYRTAGGKDKVCTKLVDESGKHPGAHSDRTVERKEYAPVSRSVFESYDAVPGEETVEYGGGRQSEVRSEEQQLVDGHVKDAYESWVAAGKPKAFNDMPRKRYMCKPGDLDSMKFMLRRAGRLHGVAVRIAPPKKHARGSVMLYWAACDQNKRHANGDGTE